MKVVLTKILGHGGLILPWFTLSLMVIITMCFLIFGAMPEALLFDRNKIIEGEYWRLITGHLVHIDFPHFAWNMTALLVLGSILEMRYKITLGKQLRIHLFSALLISILVMCWRPELQWFAGLSGVLNTYFVLFLWHIWLDFKHPVTILVAIGTLSKITFEAIDGYSVVRVSDFPVVFEAHAAGIVAGILIVAVGLVRNIKYST